MVRRHGFERPLEPLQLLTWMLLVVLVSEFYATVIPTFKEAVSWGVGVAYAICVAGCIAAGALACSTDPIDENAWKPQASGHQDAAATQDKHLCYVCQLLVNKNSRHCRFCNKCVDRFDHHCRWLNNCVGAKNYRYFLSLLVSALCLTSIQLAMSVVLIVKYHTDDRGEAQRVADNYGKLSSLQFIIVIYVFGAVTAPLVAMLVQLIGFHCMLLYEGLTTYDYIVREQKREREKRDLEDKKKAEKSQGGSGSNIVGGGELALAKEERRRWGRKHNKKPKASATATTNSTTTSAAEQDIRQPKTAEL